MKKLSFFLIILTTLGILVSCEKDETKVVVGTFNPPVLTEPSGGSSYVFTDSTEDVVMTIFKWSVADFGYQAAISYSVEVDKAGNNFENPGLVGNTNSTELAVTQGAMNNILLTIGAIPDEVNAVEVRVSATVHEDVQTLYSTKLSLNVTPFEKIIIYPSVYVPGNYQAASGYGSDWSPDQAPQLYSVKSNDKYEAYVYMANGSNEFKFTDQPNWDVNWGDDGADGTLDPNGANITAPDSGYYKMNVDLNTLTFSIMNTTWGLIGSATPNGWDSDQNMSYDVVNHEWTITLDLVAGEVKFRANDDWALNYGDDGADRKLDAGGANIVIDSDGNYTITMNLEQAVYKYKIVKN